MGAEFIIVPAFFLTIFGMVYYYLTTRNKERMALIEAGADAKLFKTASSGNNWHFVIVLGLLAIGIALGATFGMIMEEIINKGDFEQGYVVGIFLFAGLSLLASFFLIRKIKKEDKE